MTFIDWIAEDNKHSFIAYFLLTAMAEHSRDNGEGGLEEFKDEDGKLDSKNIAVELIINGVPVSIQLVGDAVTEQMADYRESVRKEVSRDLLQDASFKLQEEIQGLIEEVEWS